MAAKKTKEEIAILILPSIAAEAYKECASSEDAQAIVSYAWEIATAFIMIRSENK
jgi:hypothetical protein